MTLKIGSVGDVVRQLQDNLNLLAQSSDPKYAGAILIVDGYYGPKTADRVTSFQQRNSLVADAEVGPFTLEAIRLALEIIKAIIPAKARGPYTRMFALIYAAHYAHRVCSDGRICTKTGYPTVTPGTLIEEIRPKPAHEEDCTHFISCCIGRPPVVSVNGFAIGGGGLPLTGQIRGVYGHVGVKHLIDELKVRKYARVVASHLDKKDPATAKLIRSQLAPGDLLAYSDPNHTYQHFGLMVGPYGEVACHSISRHGDDFKDVGWPLVTLLKLP